MKKSIQKFSAALLSLFALALTFSSCSKKEASIVCVLEWTPNTNHTGLYVAQEKGYFDAEGLSVEIIQPPEDGTALMVASGRAQFGISCQDTIAPAWDKDSPLQVTAVAAILQHNTSGIISLKEVGIGTPTELESKRYSTWNNPVEQAMIQTIMEENGGDFSKVQLIPSTVYDTITALNSHDTDAVWIFYGWDGIAANLHGLKTNYLDFATLNSVFDYYTPVFIAGNEFLQKEPETARKFLRAVKKGYEYAAANPNEAADLLCKAVPELDEKLILESQKWLSTQYVSEDGDWGYITPERWNSFYEWLYQKGLSETPLASSAFFTNEYLDAHQ